MNRLSSAFAESRLVGSIAAVMLAAAASGTHAAPLETPHHRRQHRFHDNGSLGRNGQPFSYCGPLLL